MLKIPPIIPDFLSHLAVNMFCTLWYAMFSLRYYMVLGLIRSQMSAWPKIQVIYLIFMVWEEWEEPGSCLGHSNMPTLLTSWLWEPTPQKIFGFWILHSHLQLQNLLGIFGFGIFVVFLIIETGQQSDKKNHKKYCRL